MFIIFGVLFCLVFIWAYIKLNNTYKYWERKGVRGPKPDFLYGNLKTYVTGEDTLLAALVRKFYVQYKNEKIVGLYQAFTPTLLIRDPELVKNIFIKDFSSFTTRGLKTTNDQILRNIFLLEGEEWKILRQKCISLFSVSRFKETMPFLNNCAKDFMNRLNKLAEEKTPIEVRTLNRKFSTKIFCGLAFSMDSDFEENDRFLEVANTVFYGRTLLQNIVALIDGVFPGKLKNISTAVLPKSVYSYYRNLVKEKEKKNKLTARKDFMDLMIELKKQGTVSGYKDDGLTKLKITDDIMLSQACLFSVVGFETNTTVITMALYELAFNMDIQERCYVEIKNIIAEYQELTYEALNELKYVGMVFNEALRKYPTLGVLLRECEKTYKIPELNLTIEKGTKIYISLAGLQNDPEYFADPEKFDPERFSDERKRSIQSCTYMPFGDGPRKCIAGRLGKLLAVHSLSHILYNFRVKPCEKTNENYRYNPLMHTHSLFSDVWLNIERR